MSKRLPSAFRPAAEPAGCTLLQHDTVPVSHWLRRKSAAGDACTVAAAARRAARAMVELNIVSGEVARAFGEVGGGFWWR